MPVPPAKPPILCGRVFRGTWAVGSGILTPDQLRSSAWQRLRRDIYADASIPRSHLLLTRGVRLAAPRAAAFGGLTAAVLWGAEELATVDDPVEVVLPPGVRWTPGPGVRVRAARLDGAIVSDQRGLRWTNRVRTAVDLIRRGEQDDAVVLLDRLVHAGVVELGPVRDAVLQLPAGRGTRLAREVAELADGLAESPQESRLRLILQRSELPRPVAQFVVRSGAGFVARVDFAWPEHRLALEYDGVWHAEPGQFGRDRRRLNRLSDVDWRVLFATAGDLHRPAPLLRQVSCALARR